jgi:cobalt/nickel transport system ATP-binding protein
LPEILFSLKDIGFNYGRGINVFQSLHLTIETGESICLLGANGSGKSTLLKILCGLVYPDQGIFTAFGQTISEELMENDHFSQNFHRRVGFIFQNSDAQLFTTRVWDEIAFGPVQLGMAKNEVRKRVDDVITMLRLEELKERSPYLLSGGEKKKVAVASVLVLNPEVLILDEPTNGLDPRTQRWLINLLLELNRRGCTIITSTHNLELAHALSRRALVLSEQHKLVYDGPTAEALSDRYLLQSVNLIDEYCHVHGSGEHVHHYFHN